MDLRIFGRAFEKESRPIFFLSTSIVRVTGVDYYRFDPLCFETILGSAGALLKDSELCLLEHREKLFEESLDCLKEIAIFAHGYY